MEQFTEFFNAIVEQLRSLADEGGNPLYEVHWMMADTCVHGGLPQSRKRVYISGIKKEDMQNALQMPGPQVY